MKIVYISGPISCGSGRREDIKQEYINDAIFMAREVWQFGGVAILPHYGAVELADAASWRQFITGDKKVIERCDAVYLHLEWEKSPGCKEEVDHAKKFKIPILYNLSDLIAFLEYDSEPRTEYVRSFDLLDKTFMDFLHTVALPKFQKGTLEHGNETWLDLGPKKLANVYCAEEHMDLSFYHMFLAYFFSKLDLDESKKLLQNLLDKH